MVWACLWLARHWVSVEVSVGSSSSQAWLQWSSECCSVLAVTPMGWNEPPGLSISHFHQHYIHWKETLLNIPCVGATHDKQTLWFNLLCIPFAYDYLNSPCLCWLSQSVIHRCLWIDKLPFHLMCLNFINKLFRELVTYCSCSCIKVCCSSFVMYSYTLWYLLSAVFKPTF